ncbi:hypothetical protein LRY65_05485 [Candidatus Woesebacteria bacterium]|nr:hypothetical protein [Candidatus Woesebacteria bacterium]MCD8527621.1 hypothetical protein [Candidatus Woesebacteria bacterium]MCD8546407.1 hypothetical protein [Candidatus Woesebacteria bacterium]
MTKPQTDSTQFIDIDNARKEDQIQVMQEIAGNAHCPFCAENLEKYHKQPILRKTEHWLLTTNQWPYDHTQHHLLIIYKDHATNLNELATEAGTELFELVQWVEKTYNVPGGGWAMRFGDTRYSAGTINHIHVQFIVPDITAENYQPVRIKLGKSPEKLQ